MDKPLYDIDTLVIVGAWNKAILSQEWVLRNLLTEGQQVRIEYPINGVGSLKFSTDELTFFIFADRLIFRALVHNDQTYRAIVKIARSMLRLLSHTPINALGVNFAFGEETNKESFDSISDTKLLVEKIGHEVSRQELIRSFKINETQTLNFKICSDDHTIYDFNYNYNVSEPVDAINILGDTDELIVDKFNYSKGVINSIYVKE